MKPPESWSSARGWREFFDTLSDAVLVLDTQARVVFANVAALRLVPCDAGTPLRLLEGALGAAAVRWLARAASTQPDGDMPPTAALADGRAASLIWRRLDSRHSAVCLQPVYGLAGLRDGTTDRVARERAEEERDLAQMQIGALMGTAGVGLATFQQASGWVRQRPQAAAAGSAEAGSPFSGTSQSISRDIVVAASLAEYERLQVALRQDQRAEVRYEIEHAELGRRWLLTRVEPATLASGKRTTSVVTLDVTEQHRFQQRGEQLVRAERAVSLQAERTRSILDSVLVGIVNVGPAGIEWMNRSARRMFGGSLADFIGAPLATVATSEADHPFRRTRYLDDLVEGQAETFECRVRARDGREFWVVGNAVATDREQSGRQLTYALLDIERRREAEARMSEAQVALQQVIEAAPVAIALLDARTFKVVQVNVVAAAAIGATVGQLVGRTPAQIFPAKLAAARRRDLRKALAAEGVSTREYRVDSGTVKNALADGEAVMNAPGDSTAAMQAPPRTWDARFVPLAAAPGQPPDQLLLVATDVTEQRAAQEARLEAAIAQREMLVKEVHHRIKNNLQGVAGLLQQIAQRKPEVAPAIAEVVGQVQAIAQVYGLQVGGDGPLRIIGVVEAITASVQRNFGRPIPCRVVGTMRGEWALPEKEAIPIALTLNELLTNAVKHSAGGAGHGDSTGDIDCEVACNDDGVTVAVSNAARLPPSFSLARIPGSASGLGLVRALLPRRHAELSIEQAGDRVVAAVWLRPTVVTRIEPGVSKTIRYDATSGRKEKAL